MAAPMRTALKRASRGPTLSSLRPRRRLTNGSPAKAQVQPVTQPGVPPPVPPLQSLSPSRLARQRALSQTYFDTTGVLWVGAGAEQKPQDPNKAKLGKTLRVLQDRLPTLLQSPLPPELLAPNISLHLFPSTHPHLPTVSGRVAYNAALWTAPLAWNRVPIIGNVKLEILAERMTSEPLTFAPRRPGAMPEQLVVRWCEKCKSHKDKSGGAEATGRESSNGGGGGIARSLRLVRGGGVDPTTAFSGLFIFDFDSEGRVLSHTIEQAQEGGDWEKGVGAKFVGLTDWLLGGMKDPGEDPIPMFEGIEKRRCDD